MNTIKIKNSDRYTDLEIIDRILSGDIGLYEIIIRRYNSYLFKVGRSYGFNHEDTEDLMQETYLNAYSHLAKFEKRSGFKTWLIRIMLNQCYHKKQKMSFQKEMATDKNISDSLVPMFTNPDRGMNYLNKELGNVVESALNKIPEEYRMVFSLRELNGLNTNETAEALNISESNVKVRLNRARSMLRSEIEKIYSPEDIFEFNLIYCDRIVANVMNIILKKNNSK
jgi:RNA polymerase sigma factor (sigma-70 family)